ncbi:MAG: pilus assembly protein FimV [Marinobacter excellens HL-55]|uniref:Pilus assembly protein FimV n=1 Tax=Marinobacter excellens HL-55 TaxID=1305731 RepID=A0A0P7Z6Q2_9GAMM|nr:MAG: pilus assembly protein FimV [Marinobacter excellens HL-55]
MKVRKLAVAMALAGGLGSGVAQALGLGEIELQSWLNEPLDAEISLRESRGVDPGDVFVNVAPAAAYERVGIDRHQFLSRLRFEVVTGTDGTLVVNVSSSEPLREPYLNFLLELTWPNGRLMREYAVLVDPPVYAEDSGVREQVNAPTAPASSAQPAARSQESVRRQAQAESSLAGGYQASSFGPTGPSDTLWTIAQRVRPDDSVSMQQVMLALQDQNPNAFIGGNINRLKRGEVLRIPTMDQIQSRSRAQANAAVAQQNQQNQARTVDATRTADSDAAQAPVQAASSGDELRLLVADGESRDTEEGGSAGGDGDLPGGTDAGSAVAREELEATRRENEELNSRLEDLQDQVSTLQRLLELKNTQLAEMQGSSPEDTDLAESELDESAESELTAPIDGQNELVGDDAGEPEQLAEEEGALLAESEDVPSEGEQAAEVDVGSDDDMTEADQAESEAAEPEVVAAPAPAAEQPKQQTQPIAPPAADKGFPGNVIDAITGNPVYQIALGGGLVLLLLLLLLMARRNANREKAFYDQLNSDEGGEHDAFNLDLGEESADHDESEDALAEADTYIAYGRHDQAAQVLETAISREPSRTDLRLKLLGVYADNQDRVSFEKQFGEIEALDDGAAIAEANALRERLAEAESMPSIDDLESQLRSDSFGSRDTLEDEPLEDDWKLNDDQKADQFDASEEPEIENEFGELESDVAEETDSPDDLIEYDLSLLDKSDSVGAEDEKEVEESDFSSFEMDLEDSESPKTDDDDFSFDFESALDEDEAVKPAEAQSGTDVEGEAEAKPETEMETVSGLDDDLESDDVLDESFLDELDAELDKVAGEDDEPEGLNLDESTLDDLELDVSDEDLALMEEFSETELPSELEQNEKSLDEELGLEDTLSEAGHEDTDRLDQESPEDLLADAESEPVAESDEDDDLVPLASEALDEKPEQNSALDIDENDLGEEDDFDFLAGTDEAATKLDLARAYIEMGDSDGARDILEEVALEGDEEQMAEAKELLKNLS